MTSPKGFVELPGSRRVVMAGARATRRVDQTERIEVSLRLRSRASGRERAALASAIFRLGGAEPIARAEYEERHGASAADMALVEAFAHRQGLTVVQASMARRTVVLSGTAAAIGAAFGVKLRHFRRRAASYRGHTGAVYLPRELDGIVRGVFGLDNRPVARPHYRRLGSAMKLGGSGRGSRALPAKHGKALPGFSPVQIAKFYDFPQGADGAGQTIAIIELNDAAEGGMGSGYAKADLDAFFGRLGMKTPDVTAVGVDGGANLPGVDPDADGEVALDIEIAGAVAPGAQIVVYFAPNTDQGFLDAITTAVHDPAHRPTAISISWGGSEASDAQSEQWQREMDLALQAAAAMGITVCVATGDDGSRDNEDDGQAHVDFPASSPHVLACGGTRIAVAGSTIAEETAWNDGTRGGAGGGGSARCSRCRLIRRM